MKKQFVGEINAGEKLDDIFILSEKSMSQKKDGNNFLNITLGDKTGRIKGVIWDDVDQISQKTSQGDFVHVHGTVSKYKGVLQAVVKGMEPVSPEDVEPADYLPATDRNIETMFERLLQVAATIKTGCLKELFKAFWNDKEFVNKFKTAPAAKKMHHAYIGGLLEHTLSVALLADKVAGHYSGIDRDLLISGAILHDIGKILEFDYKTSIDYSDQGRLLNHIVIGLEILDEKIESVKNFPEEKALLLKHMIVSHHGQREFGSPEPPKTIEAVLLNYIDDIDSKVNGIREFMKSGDENETWTSYHRLLGRYFYRGKINS